MIENFNLVLHSHTHTHTHPHTECTQLESHAQTEALHEILRCICCATNGLNDTISLCWLLLSWFALTGMTQIVLFLSTWQVQESRCEMLHHSCTCYLQSQVFAKKYHSKLSIVGLPSHHIECPVVFQSFQCPDRLGNCPGNL